MMRCNYEQVSFLKSFDIIRTCEYMCYMYVDHGKVILIIMCLLAVILVA